MFNLYLTAFLSSLAASFLLVPLAIRLSRRFGAIDQPDPRKMHAGPMPRWGGLGIALSFFLALAVVRLSFHRFSQLLAYRYKLYAGGEVVGILSLRQQFFGILCGALVILVLGMWDDRKRLPAAVKLPFQIIAAYVAMDYGVRLSGIALPWGSGYFPFPILVSQIVTVFWLIGFMNTINLVDGLDGLAGGICAIAAGSFLVVAVLQGQTQVILFSKQLKLAGVLSAALCGACLGFLWFNFYPARVFMGDGGALFLGYMLASITVIGTLKTTALFALIIPIVVVALPIADVAISILRRLREGRKIFEPDRGHLHHRLIDQGWTQREVVLAVYVITLVLALFSILLTVFKGKV